MLLAILFEYRNEIRAGRLALIASLVSWIPAGAVHEVFRDSLRFIFLSPTFFAMTGGILLLERLFPAKPEHSVWSPALLQDFLWYLMQFSIFVSLEAAFVSLLGNFYDDWLSFLTVQSVLEWPELARVLLAVLLSDFLGWLHHVIRHKVRWFWFFHEVHHSQRQMNPWTDTRYHIVDYFEAQAVRFIPLFMLSLSQPAIVAYIFFRIWFTRFYHSNIRSNLGILRYVFVTPQSHRIHHSVLPKHQDKNFAVFLSIWDRMFGTQHPDDQSYPETGIQDSGFPMENSWRSVLSLRPLLRQQFYPFIRIWQSLRT